MIMASTFKSSGYSVEELRVTVMVFERHGYGVEV
jgi:hypothetical protein